MKSFQTMVLALGIAVFWMWNGMAPAAPAAPKPPAGKTATSPGTNTRPIPFHGTLAKVDKAAGVITLTGKSARQIYIVPETKLTKNGRPATLAEAVVGEEVGGAYREVDGRRLAVSIRFGPKPDTK